MATATNPRYSRVVSADGDQDNSAPVGADNSAGPEAAPVSPMTDTSSVCHQELPADIHQGLVSDEQHGAAEHSDTEFDDQMPTPREPGPLEPRAMTNAAMWLPGCLRRTVLLFLIALLVIFIVVLAALFGLSSRVGRLAAVNPNQSYLWTYLPIAGMERCLLVPVPG